MLAWMGKKSLITGDRVKSRFQCFAIGALSALILFLPVVPAWGAEQFEKYDIRVIRPKYFTKTNRLETGAQMSVVMNQSFIYTYLATGILDYHFSETIAIEGAAAFGFSIDKDDKKALDSSFKIKTQILRTQYFMQGGVLYTPVYGKYQLSSGRVIYLDTFFGGGVGMTGVNYIYDHCPKSGDDPTGGTSDPPAANTKSYPTIWLGGGQRIFLDKKTSIRWDVRLHAFSYNTRDGDCNPAEAASKSQSQQNITMQVGAGFFL
ncbi:MAG: outer membrane beta-barrel domain-containing protein [Proteobacteria bacterium]|nr:outer membrane beta-barrel domain-containing protein [Pseudomonadota bacterium]